MSMSYVIYLIEMPYLLVIVQEYIQHHSSVRLIKRLFYVPFVKNEVLPHVKHIKRLFYVPLVKNNFFSY